MLEQLRRVRIAANAVVFVAVLTGASVDANEGGEIDLADLSLGELMDLEVSTPGKVSEALRDTPASVYLFGRSDIEAGGYRNLTDILENVPGFYNINNYNGASGNFGVRGFWNGRSQNGSIAFLVNGVPQSRMDARSHPMELLNIPVEAINRIEVSRGPNSVIYGNGASFGAINIITDESYNDDRISVSHGSYGTNRVAGRWSAFSEDSHVILNTGWSRTDGVDPLLSELMGPENQLALSLYGVSDPDTSLGGRLEQETNYANLAGEWRNLYFDFSYNQSEIEHFPGAPPVDQGSVRDSSSYRFMVGGAITLSEEATLDTKVHYSDFQMSQVFDAFFPGFDGNNTLEYNGLELESLLTYEPLESVRILSGINWQRMYDMYEYTYVPVLGLNNEVVDIGRRETQSFFTQFSYEANESLRFVGGFRIEELKRYLRVGYTNIEVDTEPTFGGMVAGRRNFTPRASVIYEVSDSHLFKLMLGDALKISPSVNTYFSPEKTRTIELNYTHSREDVLFNVSLFRNVLNGLQIEELQIQPGGGVDTDTFAGGRVETVGLEFLTQWTLDDFWHGEFGVTLQDSDDKARPDRPLSYSPKSVFHGKWSYRNNGFTGSLLGRYVGSMLPFYLVSTPVPGGDYGAYIGDEIGGYVVADANFRWDEIWNDLYMNVRVSNLFDREVRYPNNPINSTILDRGTIGEGRSLQLTLGLEF